MRGGATEKVEIWEDTQIEFAGHASVSAASSSEAQKRASSDWNADTGASSHMTPHRHWFLSYMPHVVPVRVANNSIIWSAGIGSVEFQPLIDGKPGRRIVFHDTLHVPALGSNLLSLFHLTRMKGYKISIVDDKVDFCRNGLLLFTATVTQNNIGYLDGQVITHSANFVAPSLLTSQL